MIDLYASRFPEDAWRGLVDALQDSLSHGHRAYLVVPSQFTVEAEQALFEALDTKVLMQAQVKSFHSLVRDILQEGSGLRTPLVTEEGRRMLVRLLLEENKDKRRVFTPGTMGTDLCQAFVRQLREWKEYGVSPDTVEEKANTLPEGDRTRQKLLEMAQIYRAYEETLGTIRFDSDDELTWAFQQLSSLSVFDGVDFFFDRFHSLSKREADAVRALVDCGHALHFTMTLDPQMAKMIVSAPETMPYTVQDTLLSDSVEDAAAFSLSARFARQLSALSSLRLHAISKMSIPSTEAISQRDASTANRLQRRLDCRAHEEQDRENGGTLSLRSAVDIGARSVFSLHPPKERLEKTTVSAPITFVRYRNSVQEVEGVIVEIKKRMQQEGAKENDFALFLTDSEEYAPLLKRALQREGLRFFYDEIKEVNYHPLLRTIRALLLLSEKGPRPETMLSLVKAGLLGIEEEDIESYQRYLEQRNIRYRMVEDERYFLFIDKDLRLEEKERERRTQEADTARRVNRKILDYFYSFNERMQNGKTVRDFAKALVYALRTPETAEALFHYEEKLRKEGEEERLALHRQIWDAIMTRLEEMVNLFAEREMDCHDFAALCEEGLSGISLGVIPPFADQIFVGDLLRSRLRPRPYVFIVGVSDAYLPGVRKEDALLSEEEKALLSENNALLPSTNRFALEEERLNFYSVLHQASVHLTLSSAMQNQANESMNPSPWMLRMKKALHQPMKIVDAFSFSEMLYSKGLLLTGLPAILQDADVPASKKENVHALLERMRVLPAYREMAEAIIESGMEEERKPLAVSLVQQLYPANTLSASQLEDFARCPYHYFLRYGLRVEEERPFRVNAPDMGNLLHAAVDRWTTYITPFLAKNTLPSFLASEEAIRKEGANVLVETMDSIKRRDPRNAFFLRMAEKTLMESHARIFDHVENSAIKSIFHEYPFGPNQVLPGLLLTQFPRKVVLRGRIDRLDVLKDSQETYVEVLDYKTGSTSFSLSEILGGVHLQLPLYLRIAEEIGKPFGAFYFPLRAPKAKDADEKETERSGWDKDLQLDGFLRSDSVATRFDTRLEDSGKESAYALYGRKIKEWTARDNVLQPNEVDHLLDTALTLARSFTDSREQGAIAARPLFIRGAKKVCFSGCAYCPFQAICRFEKQRHYNKQRFMEETSWTTWKEQVRRENQDEMDRNDTEQKGGE